MFVRVAVNIPSHRTFSYLVPEHLEKKIDVGKRVLVPFGRKRITGYLLDAMCIAGVEQPKELMDVLDRDPLFNEDDWLVFLNNLKTKTSNCNLIIGVGADVG